MKKSRILSEVHETATAMFRSGAIDTTTMGELDALTSSPEKVEDERERGICALRRVLIDGENSGDAGNYKDRRRRVP